METPSQQMTEAIAVRLWQVYRLGAESSKHHDPRQPAHDSHQTRLARLTVHPDSRRLHTIAPIGASAYRQQLMEHVTHLPFTLFARNNPQRDRSWTS
jgi:hypothetical protein